MITSLRPRGRNRLFGCVGFSLMVALVLGASVFLAAQVPQLSDQLPENADPLVVTLTTPLNGAEIPLDEPMEIAAEAIGAAPIRALELWVDGERLREQTWPESNLNRLRAVWNWKPSAEGVHTLVTRARDAQGGSGDSNVVRVLAQKGLPATVSYFTRRDDTVEGVAQQFKATAQQIVDLNPTLDPSANLPAGERLLIPVPTVPILSSSASIESDQGPEQEFAPLYSDLPVSLPTPPSPPPPPTVPTGATQPASDPPDKNLFWLKRTLANLMRTPERPSTPELAATVERCQVRLYLSDRSNNEDGFFIYRLDSRLSAPKRVATIGPGGNPAPILFMDSGLYGQGQYFVAAFNSAGESPSNYVGVQVTDPTCSATAAHTLALTRLNLEVATPIDKVYAYVSIDDGYWTRIPSGQNQFIYRDQTGFNMSPHLDRIPVPPGREEFSIVFEVWGWQDESLVQVGRAVRTFSSTQGQGDSEIRGEGFVLRAEFSTAGEQAVGSPFAPSIAPPTRLASTSDPDVCGKHVPTGLGQLFTKFTCRVGIGNNYIVLVWNWKPWEVCPFPHCITVEEIDGYKVYRIKETAYSNQIELVRTVTGAEMQVALFPWEDSGSAQCFVVRAFKGAMESDSSKEICLQLPPMGLAQGTDTPFTPPGWRFDAETAAAVIPPHSNQGCWNTGRLFIGAGSSDGTSLLSRDLVGSGAVADIRTLLPLPAPDNQVPAFDPFKHDYKGQTLPQHFLTTDQQITRLANGDLVFIRHGHTVAPLTPQPSWWNNLVGTGLSPRPGERTAPAVWRSSDCGNTWTLESTLDAAVVSVEGEAGRCGWPKKKSTGYAPAGFDRVEIYVDPWIGTLYYTAACGAGAGTPHEFAKVVLFASKNNGKTWEDGRALDYSAKPEVWTPVLMTSVPSGRLYLFGSTSAGEPRLFWSDDQGKTLNGPHVIYFGDSNDDTQVGLVLGSKIPGGQRNGGYPIAGISAIARIKSTADEDVIIVSYASVVGKTNPRQVQRILSVHIKSDQTVTAIPIKTIAAEHPLGHVLQATFIETDRVQLPKNYGSNPAVLYWVESTDKELFARYAVVRDEFLWTAPADLSVSGGQRRSWTPNNNGWAGDYMHGAFFFDGANLNYLAQWPESESQYTNPNMVIHYNVVQVPLDPSGPVRQIK